MTAPTMIEISKFAIPASDAQIERTALALEENNIHVIVTENGVDAKKALFKLIPDNAEVFKLTLMDRKTQKREMEKMGATPEYMVGSVHAVTENGHVIIASNTGSQLAGYVSAAAHIIWVVGTQKIVPTFEDGMERLEEYTFPLENARALQAYGVGSNINKLLIVNKEYMSGRTTIIFVKENLGF